MGKKSQTAAGSQNYPLAKRRRLRYNNNVSNTKAARRENESRAVYFQRFSVIFMKRVKNFLRAAMRGLLCAGTAAAILTLSACLSNSANNSARSSKNSYAKSSVSQTRETGIYPADGTAAESVGGATDVTESGAPSGAAAESGTSAALSTQPIRGTQGAAQQSTKADSPAQTNKTNKTTTAKKTFAETTAAKTAAHTTTRPQTTEKCSIDSIIRGMTLEQKVGQLFIARCPDSGAATAVSKYHPGGYVLFGRDFKNQTKSSMVKVIKSYQSKAKIPLLIAVDEEGGDVNRVSLYKAFRSSPFLSPQKLYAAGGWKRIDSDAAEKAKLLRSLGINVNLAPVCDVAHKGSFIYSRTFGSNAAKTSEFVRRTVGVMQTNKVGTVLKHFPGYGDTKDTHTGIAYDNRPYESFVKTDFLPFRAGINAGAGAVLVSHNIVKCMDAKYPASLSVRVHEILREELGFDGVIMTDDLYMDAITDYTGGDAGAAAIRAIVAGNDLLCCTDFKVQIPAVIKAVKSGKISVSRIEESVRRVLIWKRALGLI